MLSKFCSWLKINPSRIKWLWIFDSQEPGEFSSLALSDHLSLLFSAHHIQPSRVGKNQTFLVAVSVSAMASPQKLHGFCSVLVQSNLQSKYIAFSIGLVGWPLMGICIFNCIFYYTVQISLLFPHCFTVCAVLVLCAILRLCGIQQPY